MNKLGVLAGVCSILSFGVLGCNENPTSVIDLEGKSEGEISSSSSQESKSSGEITLRNTQKKSSSSVSSSSVKSESRGNGLSSSSVRSSSSKAVSSSSRPPDSFSSPESSSSDAPIETKSWYGHATYTTAKVVASNADELECNESTVADNLNGYDVAYEFNLPRDLGRDSFGKHPAYIDNTVNPVSAECGSIIFDGLNGLIIPLDEIFKSKGFVAEVRFMPTKEGNMANIFVAEPPGSGKTGWQIRLDGTDVVFHMRDPEVRKQKNWESITLGEVSLNEWHVVRIKIFPRKSELTGKIVYTFNAFLDGKMRRSSEYNGDVSNIEYGLGIGYDSMYQTLHNDRYFTGKIDYIRYGKITEDGL